MTRAAPLRRIVTFVDEAGRSRMQTETTASRVADYVATPGMRSAILWATSDVPVLDDNLADPAPAVTSIHPPAGGSTFLLLTLPPGHVYVDPAFDPDAAAAEAVRLAPGIADRMELDAPGFHRTETLDYVVVLSGEVWLALDDEDICLRAGDTVVQGGARHAWQNRSNEETTLAVVLLGARR